MLFMINQVMLKIVEEWVHISELIIPDSIYISPLILLDVYNDQKQQKQNTGIERKEIWK
jgi:hypothetical protein